MKVLYIMLGVMMVSSLAMAQADEPTAKGPTCEQKLAQAAETNAVQGEYINRLLKVRSQQEASGLSNERIIKSQQETIADLKGRLAKLAPKEK